MSRLIKWTGSKETQAQEIISKFPYGKVDTYWEPFIGGGAVFLNLVEDSSNILMSINRFYISDYNKELVEIWKMMQTDYGRLLESYAIHYKNHNITLGDDYDTCINRQKYFKKVRSKFNSDKRPEDLFFLMRTCVNGLVRYNRKGHFNSGCHFSRPGMSFEEVSDTVKYYNYYLTKVAVEIHHHSYESIRPSNRDIVYLDPPYENTTGQYYGGFDNKKFIAWVNSLTNTRWFLSYDGSVDGADQDHTMPVYREKFMLSSGQSQVRKVLNDDPGTSILESLYVGGLGNDCSLESVL
jgi:DNA adenine methylase